MIPRIIGSPRHDVPMIAQHLRLRKAAKTAGLVVLGLIALDLIATVTTLALGAQWLKR